MKQERALTLVAALVLALGPACASSSSDNITGAGGATGSGGGHATGGSSATGGRDGTGGASSGGATGTGGSRGSGGVTGTGGTVASGGTNGSGGAATGGSSGTGGRGGSGGAATGGSSGTGGATATGGATGSGGSSQAASCTDDQQNGSETGVDCGGSCPACPNYKINPPNLKNNASSACGGGTGFMCARSMVFSPEFKQAAADDFGSPANPAFVYGVVGHDADQGALDSSSNTCCQCYQLVFTTPRDPVSGVPAPKPMIVQAFNTAAGGGKNFDIYMAMGGYGSNNGCPGMYSSIPTIGEPGQGGVRVENLSQCSANNMYSYASVSTMSCQSALVSQCDMLKSSSAMNQSTSQTSCVEANQPDSLYHMNWNVLAKRVECPTNLTRVTGCKLNGQGLPAADPTAVDQASASGKGFSSGYTTTTMQDCCRPTCAYSTNVTKNGVSADSQYGAFYTCDASGNPS
jgi:hypothetical protein